MTGPTPVSALIHAATMVTAGVYLIARSAAVYNASQDGRTAVLLVGAITLMIGAIIGCAYDDIKKVLAYSTVSQIGYMVLATGLGTAGYALGIAHLLAHGFFKSTLFLSAGSVDGGHGRHHGHAKIRGLDQGHDRHARHLPVRVPGDHRNPAVLGLLDERRDHRGHLGQGRHLRHAAGDHGDHRGGLHRVLHDPAHVDDVLEQVALAGGSSGRTTRRR